jgi:hypothetical protein
MVFSALFAGFIARILSIVCTTKKEKVVTPPRKAIMVALDNSISTGSGMGTGTIYSVQQNSCMQYALDRLNDGSADIVCVSIWNNISSPYIELKPVKHLFTGKATSFSNWVLPPPSGGTTPICAFNKAIDQIRTIRMSHPNASIEFVISTDGTSYDGDREGPIQQQLVNSCQELMSKKDVSMTVIGIIPQQVDYTKITESQPIPGLTLANLLFKYVSKCLMCSGSETKFTTVFQRQEQTNITGISFCNEFPIPMGTNIKLFLKEFVRNRVEVAEWLTMEQYDLLLDSVISLCNIELTGIVNPLSKNVPWFEEVKRAMITIGTTIYLKADPSLTQQQVKNAVTEKFTENFKQNSEGNVRLCSGDFIQGKRAMFQEVSAQLKASGTLSVSVDMNTALFIVHDPTDKSYKFVRVNSPNIRQNLCTVQGMPHSGYNYTSLALPDITDPRIFKELGQLVRQAVRGSWLVTLPNFKGDNKDPVFIFLWGVEFVKGMLMGLPLNSDHMEILKLLFCTMADKKVMGSGGKESTLLQEWKKGIFTGSLDDGKSILQVLLSPYLDLNGIEPHDMEGLLFAILNKSVFESFVKHEQICTLRLRMGLQHPPSFDEFMAYVSTKYAHLKLTDKHVDAPFYCHSPYSPFDQDFMDMGEEHGQLWSVLPHTINGNHCDVKHQDGGFHCTDLERINMMGCNGGKCLYCRQPLMPCHFEKVEGSWPTLQTFLDGCIPLGTPPPAPAAPAVQESVAPTPTVQRSMAPSQPPTPRVSIVQGGGGAVPPMPNRMSNNRNKTWSKYVKLYNKTGDQAHLNVLLEMVREESSKSAPSAP